MADAYDNEDEKYCKIYDRNDFFTMLVQILLAFGCLGALWYKRLTETPRRTFWTWFMDVFKQAAGACYAHVLNMVRFLGERGHPIYGRVQRALLIHCCCT